MHPREGVAWVPKGCSIVIKSNRNIAKRRDGMSVLLALLLFRVTGGDN